MNALMSYYSRPFSDPYSIYWYDEEPLSNNDYSFLAATAKIAATSQYRFRMAAMLVKSGRVLGADTNLYKVTRHTPPNRLSTHAEVRVLNGTKNTEGATLYVARLRGDHTVSMAKPCAWCLASMLRADINKVVFSTGHDTGSAFYLSTLSWSHNCAPH
jgi:tRNA(Arg) A34 adenosine deaminase TadA